MFVSLDGLLCRMKGRKDQRFMVGEFLKHYAMAKKAHAAGDSKTLEQFFSIYVVGKQWLPEAVDNSGVGVACG